MKRPLISILKTVCLVLVLTTSGCNRNPAGDLPALHPVHGMVTLNGQPLAGASLVFLPESGPSSGAITDADGKYEAMHRSGAKGAVAGPTKVSITTSAADAEGNYSPEKLPPRYNEATTLNFTVIEGDNEQNFELKSK